MNNTKDNIYLASDKGDIVYGLIPNKLEDKWKREGYTKNIFNEQCSDILYRDKQGNNIHNYSCVLCKSDKCYLSEKFKVPEEDIDEYNKWIDNISKIIL